MTPYKPPSARVEDRPSPWSPQTIKPRILPRDALDVVLVLVLLPYQMGVIFGIPCYIVWALTDSSDAVCIAFLIVYGVFLTFVVWSLRFDADGIHFRRLLGKPKLIPWNELRMATVVSRSELVLHGWIWPLYPPRETTFSLSALGHVRFDWPGGYCYFAPADVDQFLAEIRSHQEARAA